MQHKLQQRRRLRVWLLLAAISTVLVSLALLRNSTAAQIRLGGAYDCFNAKQASPILAAKVEGVPRTFFLSIADLGTPEKPNRNFQRVIKGKPLQRPAISVAIQQVLSRWQRRSNAAGVVLDVGANVGMATFAAAAMGFKVLAFEPVDDNLNKLCDGVYLNRASDLVTLFHAAVSDSLEDTTLHKVVGRLDNTAVSREGAQLAFKSNEIVPFIVRTLTLDSLIPDSLNVALVKVDVQGWEHHVFRGARRLLSRPPHRAPYLIYEDDDKLLAASNSSSPQIRHFLHSSGYGSCIKVDNDMHCSKHLDDFSNA